MGDKVRIAELEDPDDAAVRGLLVDLTLDEQEHFDHPRETRAELERRLRPARHFSGENRILVARDEGGTPLGLCWIALFDPGTGLEAEIAELYVRPDARGRGIATRLAREAVRLIRGRHVTFACVWTRGDNPAALAVYRAAGFAPTEQTVLTWLPLETSSPRHADTFRDRMTLSPQDVEHVALLARLGLDEEERVRLGGQLDAILVHIAKLQQVDTSGVTETAQVGGLVNVMRDDVPEPSLGAARALQNAAATDGAHFVVGAIQEHDADA